MARRPAAGDAERPRPGRLLRRPGQEGAGAGEHRPAGRNAENLLCLPATRRCHHRESRGVDHGGEAGRRDSRHALAGPGGPTAGEPRGRGATGLPRPGPARVALRHGLPCLRGLHAPHRRRASWGELLHLPRQGQQGAGGAARPPGDRGCPGVARRPPAGVCLAGRWDALLGGALDAWQPTVADADLGDRAAACRERRCSQRRRPSHAAAQFRHASRGGGRGPPARAGDARTRQHRHDAAVHPR